MRRDITNIVNALAAGVPEYARLYVDVIRMYYLILDYCKRHKTSPRRNDYRLDNGLFYINGQVIERVHPLPSKIMDSLEAEHWESRCLSMTYEEV